MRTTLSIDDDVLDLAREIAEAQGGSVGKALSGLARRGIRGPVSFRMQDGFPVFEVPSAPSFGPEDVKRALEQEYEEELEKSAPTSSKKS